MLAPLQAVYEEVMLHRSAGDASVMDGFEVPFEAAERWIGEETTSQQSFTRCAGCGTEWRGSACLQQQ